MDKHAIYQKAGWVKDIPAQALHMVPQKTARMYEVAEEPTHVSCWDYNISPEGRHFFSVCAEGTTPGYARLYEYLPTANTVRLCFRLEDVTVTHDEAVRPSKIHSSIDFLPDGRVIMTSHTTAAAPQHPRWLPFAYYPDLWEGYPGSNLLIYDPKTGKVDDYGIPVPHESIYGGTYEATTDSYYFSGYMRGHMYRYDLKTRKITDFGQCTEFGTWRYIHACDGNLYTTTATGRLVKLDVAAQTIHDIPYDFPIKPELLATGTNNKMNQYAFSPEGFWLIPLSCDHILHYSCKTGEVTDHGCFVPPLLAGISPKVRCMGLTADDTGRLWYLQEVMGLGLYLVSQDILHGGEPVLHGLLGIPQRAMGASFGCFVRDGVLYASDTNRGTEVPAVFQVSVASLFTGKTGPLCVDPKFYLALQNGEELYRQITGGNLEQDADSILRQRLEGWEDRHSAGFISTMPLAYREHPETFNGDSAFNVTILPHSERWVCKLWKTYGTLSVRAVGFEPDGTVWVQDDTRRIRMQNGHVIAEIPALALPENQALQLAQNAYLPHQAERRHLGNATAACYMSDGRIIAGTEDGMLAFIRPNGKVFSIGSIGLGQPVHQLAAYPTGKRVIGVAGGKNDLGMVFTYDDEVGLILHGRIFFQDYHSVGVLGASSEPYRVAVSADGRYAAIAVRDRLTCVYWFKLDEELID